MTAYDDVRNELAVIRTAAAETDRAAGRAGAILAAIEDAPPPPPVQPIGIGFGTGNLPEPADVGRVADELQAIGITRVRITLPWAACQPRADSPIRTPAKLASQINGFADAGMGVLLIPAYCPPWQQTTPTQFAMPKDPAAFGRFVAAVVDEWAATVDEWEVWNEPNHDGPPGLVMPSGQSRGGGYARLMQAAAPMFPRWVTVLGGGGLCPAPDNPPHALRAPSFVRDWFAADAMADDRFDRLSIHPYAGKLDWTNDTEWSWPNRIIPELLDQLRASLSSRPDPYPLTASECGYRTAGNNAVTEAQQGPKLIGMVEGWRKVPGAGAIYLFCWRDFDTTALGLWRKDGTPKPAVAALREAFGR